ncbi:MAG: hypothetical protein NC093_00090 [Alistipes sp.]|nr:hypothetical protein [Alistipes sp.]
MKKLISAASALAMAASMVGAAVPFATGAADASKALELRVFANPDGTTPSTTISAEEIAAGDVTIPVGVYYVENTADSKGVTAMWTVSSEDGDATNKYVTFNGYAPGSEYFSTPQTFTVDKEYKTNRIPGFAGKLTSGKAGVTFTSQGLGNYTAVDSQETWNLPNNAYGSVVWTKPSTGDYTWTGTTSDAFPMYVFDVTFKKGTPAGTYSIDFLNELKAGSTEIWSSMIEGTTTFTKNAGNLDLTGLEIKIEGDSQQKPTEAETKAPTQAETKAPTQPGTSAGNDEDAWRNDPYNGDFIIAGEVVRYDEEFERHEDYKPGDTVTVEFVLKDSLGKEATTLAAIPKTDDAFNAAGLKLVMEDAIDYTSPDLATWTLTGETYYCYRFDPNTKDPKPFNDGEAIISFNVELPADLAPGDYVVDLERFSVFEQTQPKVAFRTTPQPAAVIHIDGDVEPTQAETKAPTQAETKAPTATPTTKPTTAPGTPLYGDANDDKEVNIADVVVLNKWLNDNKSYDLTAQGKLNADCCDPKAGEDINQNDSDAIIMSIVHLVKDADGNAKALPYTAADLK